MRWLSPAVFLSLTLLGVAVQALSTSGSRLLVILDEGTEKGSYSKFWEDLEARGFKLSFESPKNDKLSLFQHGARAYDHLILLPPRTKGLGPALTPKVLLQFLNDAGNILLTLSSNSPTPTAISSLLLELGINLPSDRTSLVIDHFNYDTISAAEKHDVVLLPRPAPLRPDVKNYFGGKDTDILAFPRGVGQVLENSSPHLAPVLRAPDTAYAYNPKDEANAVEDPFAVGQQLNLVSTMQARNSARFTVLGSVEVLENSWFDAKVKSSKRDSKQTTTANRAFAAELSAWTFKELGVLKVDKIEHSLKSPSTAGQQKSTNASLSRLGDLNPKIYRVKNDVIFTISLSEYHLTHYKPLNLPTTDSLQLEFSMLSPFHRLPLTPSPSSLNTPAKNSTLFTTTLTLPDQHGIFNFRVNYKRPFLTNVDEKRTVTVRHFAHDEWPRSWSISGGWPWIAGVAVTVGGWLAFVALWLWSEPAFEKGRGKKVQ